MGIIKCSNLKTEYETNPMGLTEQKPRFSWCIEAENTVGFQKAYRIRVATKEKILSAGQADMWDSGKVLSGETIHIEYEGAELKENCRYYWTVQVWNEQEEASEISQTAYWQTGIFNFKSWEASWIVPSKEGEKTERDTSPLLRKEFNLKGNISQATAYVYALGWYELYINGQKAGDRVLAPTSTPPGKELLYVAIDVTDMVKSGENAAGFWLGDGYNENYNQYGWHWEGEKRAFLQLQVQYEDGSAEKILTDGSWKYTIKSPILHNHIYNGETYDARLELKGWSEAGFDDSSWKAVKVLKDEKPVLKADRTPGVKVMETFRPVKIYDNGDGIYTFDMGQNFAGWCRLAVAGKAGTEVRLRHSENIDNEGRLDTWTNRNAKAEDVYILKGEGLEEYEPRFTYHGFRYVEISGYPGIPDVTSLTGCAIHSDVGSISSFVSSSSLLNQIQHNICWSMKSNLLNFPTDCPNRDERTPCKMDSAVYEEAAIHNLDMHSYYVNWLTETAGDKMTPDWSGESITLAKHLYDYYGDKRVLERIYPILEEYLAHCHTQAPEYIFTQTFGDWCAPNADNAYENSFSSISETTTALYYMQLMYMADIAGILGKKKDIELYRDRAVLVKEAYHKAFYEENQSCYSNGKQTPNILPLVYHMAADDVKEGILKGLLKNISEKDGHLDTGIYGTRYLLEGLAANGKVDTAWEILHKTTYPGFGYEVALGATTFWEQWGNGIGKFGMQSHNHAMFAGIGASFYTVFAGIQSIENAYKKIRIKPVLPKELTFVECRCNTIRGEIKVNWKKADGSFRMNVTIPGNCCSEIYLPVKGGSAVSLNGIPVKDMENISYEVLEDRYLKVELGNGEFSFEIR